MTKADTPANFNKDYNFKNDNYSENHSKEKRVENLKYEFAQELGISHRNMGKHSKQSESIK